MRTASGTWTVPLSIAPDEGAQVDLEVFRTAHLDCAKDAAARFLSYSERSTGQLRDRLRSLEYDTLTVEAVIEWASERGYVNDVRFASVFAGSKTMGTARLKAELRRRGAAESAIRQVLSEQPDDGRFNRAVEQVREKYGGLPSKEKARRRAAGWLGRRGFSTDFILRVLREAL